MHCTTSARLLPCDSRSFFADVDLMKKLIRSIVSAHRAREYIYGSYISLFCHAVSRVHIAALWQCAGMPGDFLNSVYIYVYMYISFA